MKSLLDTRTVIPDGRHHDGHTTKLSVRHVNAWYGEKQALEDVTFDICDREVTALIGPSGCGKSTLLTSLNRIAETVPGYRLTGDILLDGKSIFDPDVELEHLRRRFGWIAQMPNPFPEPIRENVAYGARIHGIVEDDNDMDGFVEQCLRRANLWDEVKDILDQPGTSLSGGQQQRLCIARALSTNPDVILMDEPCSALDPGATGRVEELIDELRADLAIVIITHNLQQAARVSQRTAFFHLGKLIEFGDTEDIFLKPRTELCNDYVTGRYG
ncbi:Phosphate import ATP-binding protein PstB [Hartmannibacter diazotrophicus]|uniref:Phosphate import ATP-binding protein PstB n=1 Tax=Hartmannibacter diazotrophicus TaxID=1482074 RepID=A0A2C9D0N3_9HYPH|nr:phosphate ABC transporter ATP-binding protein [Hartmannibacter diazotrophicus]SON53937.1 Phosphate import ATP-binding protein PstB [Hartmannibacter diazotrophicus]